MLCMAPAASATVIADIISVGHSALATDASRRVVRMAAWTPVVVELSLRGDSRFDGRLRLGQADRDGDVAYDEREVHLLGDSAAPQRYTLYTLPQPSPNGSLDISVELLDQDDGRLVPMICGGREVKALQPADPLDVLSDDAYLILEISEGQMGRISTLVNTESKFRAARDINIAHIAPADAPDRWQGLEAVDCVVWDDADPDALNEAQRLALAEWTRQGGLLLVAGAKRAPALAKSAIFGPMLPVEVGDLTAFRDAKEFRHAMLNLVDETERAYPEDVVAVRCTLRDGPGIRRIFPPTGHTDTDAELDTMIAKRRLDRGQVIFVCVALRELLNDPKGDAGQFFQRVLEIRRAASDERYGRETALAPLIESKVGFNPLAGIYMLIAMLFVTGYVALATFGSWSFLRSRGWEKHNWTVFAVVAVAAAVFSTVAVQALLGVGQALHQVSIVDASAGKPSATATAYFGIKTGTHSTLDFWLPENYTQQTEPVPTDCFLRPLSSGRAPGDRELTYADPGSYELRPVTAELARVPVRATLKQLEGRWRGELRGTVQASIRIVEREVETGEDPKDGEKTTAKELCFDDNSTVTNLLGLDLVDAYVFQIKKNVVDKNFVLHSPRARDDIAVHRLGPIKDQETVNLASKLYIDPDTATRLARNKWKHTRALSKAQDSWGSFSDRSFTGVAGAARGDHLEGFQNVLLLATGLSEYHEGESSLKEAFSGQKVTFSRERCRPLDLSDLLSTDMVLLVGFAPTPGPVSLCTRTRSTRDYKRLAPSEAWTMYRIVIPVEGPR